MTLANHIRAPAVAGRFYSSRPERLQFAVDAYLEEALPAAGTSPVGLIVPHAGLLYSGQIAADAYRQAAGGGYDLIVVLGTNHSLPHFSGVAIAPDYAFATPLGEARLNQEAAERIVHSSPCCRREAAPHRAEHSVEVQLPFIQTLFPGVPIVAAIVGLSDPDECVRFGEQLAQAIAGRKVLIVASSDLSHYPSRDDACRVDAETLDAILDMDPEALHQAASTLDTNAHEGLLTRACGEAPVLAAMAAARSLGAKRARIVSYANSGETLLGEQNRVVGYGAVAMEAEQLSAVNRQLSSSSSTTLSADDHAALTRFAHRALQMFLGGEVTPLPRGFSTAASAERGVFVSLYNKGDLRGCVGHIQDDKPLARAVGEMALAAALDDFRFPPVGFEELANISVEISALTEPRPIKSADEIVPGRDGVIIHKGGRQGVFLPKVATEKGWDTPTLLEHLSTKAGLPAADWKKGAELLTFQAEVFGDRLGL